MINGLKFDLRIYALLTCVDPLRLYIYDEGIVRFATEPYTLSGDSLSNKFIHLTNFSINKNSEKFKQNKTDDEELKYKWLLTNLKVFLKVISGNDEEHWFRPRSSDAQNRRYNNQNNN